MMTRLIVLLAILACSATSSAAPTDAKADFDITPFVADGTTFDRILLDVESTPRFMQAHGMLFSSTASVGAPVTGTCLFSSGGGAFCSLSYGSKVIYLTVQTAGNGTYQVRDATGSVLWSGNAQLATIK
jgi:hypothetical protein